MSHLNTAVFRHSSHSSDRVFRQLTDLMVTGPRKLDILSACRIYHVEMSEIRIQLLVFKACPLADAARDALEVALTMVGLPKYEEVDILDPSTADELRGWGSPTILIDGQDVAGNVKGDSVGCRVYDGPGRVPSAEDIAAVIRNSME
jgi:hypothetical protein